MLRGKINAESLSQINKDIEELSPHPQKVKIIAVTKNFSFSAVQEALKYNIINIGENKIQEFEHKQKNKKIPRVTITHFIGRLQRNKVKKAVRLFNIIQSIDSLKIAEKVNKEAEKIHKKQKIYLQINIAKDPTKQGFREKEIYEACKKIKEMKNLEVLGTMTIIPQEKDKKRKKTLFQKITKITKKIKTKHLPTCLETSMGMSQDYKEALESGATNIRVGTKLYGKRT